MLVPLKSKRMDERLVSHARAEVPITMVRKGLCRIHGALGPCCSCRGDNSREAVVPFAGQLMAIYDAG